MKTFLEFFSIKVVWGAVCAGWNALHFIMRH